ncbi:unnamed protein product [Umbelopsis ramanniana]
MSKRLQWSNLPDVQDRGSLVKSTGNDSPMISMKLLDTRSSDKRAINVIQTLFDCFEANLFMSNCFCMLELNTRMDAIPPKWASRFDRMKGIIREPGRLIVQIPAENTASFTPTWRKKIHPYLRFIDAVYACRRSSTNLDEEAFSDILGGIEVTLATDLHAILIAGLSILSIAGGDGLVEKLVTAILVAAAKAVGIAVWHEKRKHFVNRVWDLHQDKHSKDTVHRPLSPVATAKAVGIAIWRDRRKQIVNRVWDLHQDKLVDNIDARRVIFITHRWSGVEKSYQDVMKLKRRKGQTISGMSEILYRIRTSSFVHTRYVWIDTICIDKSNLSELDEAIRSMYKWYASCAAVVLDSGTPLSVWCKRGWCLQEGAAAGLLCGISKEGTLVTIQELAKEQHQDLCTLDLHLYYRQGNAAEISARMSVRETTREEDMAYALAGIFSIHLPMAYGEGLESRERLLHQLAIRKGDLSFLSFKDTQTNFPSYLPSIRETNYSIAVCQRASVPISVSHFGILFEVRLIKGQDISPVLQKLTSWKDWDFAKGRSLGVEELIEAAGRVGRVGNSSASSVDLAIIHDIRSLMLVEAYDVDWQTGGEQPNKVCCRIQCCQIEETEFERLFDETDADFERIWLGDKAVGVAKTKANGSQSRNRGRRSKRDSRMKNI